MDLIIILQAGVASGTVLLFATLGEIFSERAGVLNLGVEGMMLIGAMAAFSATITTGNGWVGLLMAMVAAGLLALLHGVVTIHFQADQVVSGLALTFLGTGLSLVFGEGLSAAGTEALRSAMAGGFAPWERLSIPLLSLIPVIGPVFFSNHSIMTYLGYLLVPLAWYYINRTRPGLHLRAVGDNPTAADSMGINVYRLRYLYVVVGGMLAGLAGGTISLVASPGWFSDLTTSGQGWIAVGLVIFAQWDPWRAAFGAYAFGTLRRLIYDIQGPATILGVSNPFFLNSYLGFFLAMLPYAFTILVLVIGSRDALRKRLGAPAALGYPYIRGERGN
ncbi:MAG: ABC transporter permease [Anaerolineales bacterium]|nr:ABC transporter permease [Anaerolineales bacterium]